MNRRPKRPRFTAGLLCVLHACFSGIPASASTVPLLPLGEIATGTLAPNEVAHFSLELPEDHSLRLIVQQQEMDVTTTLLDATGRRLAVADRNLGEDGDEWLEVITPAAGVYDLEVKASSRHRPPGSFVARLDHLRPATERDRQIAEVFEIFSRGSGLLVAEEGTDREALLLEAAARFEELDHPLYQAETLTRLAERYGTALERESSWRRATALFERVGDLPAAAYTYNGLSGLLVGLDRYGEAEEGYRASLEITNTVQDRVRRALALDGLGKVARNQGRAQEALDSLEAALDLWREHEVSSIGSSRHDLGVLYLWNLHQTETAIHFLEGAMESWRALADQGRPLAESSVDLTLGQLAQAYLDLGDLAQARELLQEALDLQTLRSCRVIPTLTKLAGLEQRAGAPVKARTYLLLAAQNLSLGCPREESSVWLAHLEFFLAQEAPKSALLAADRCARIFQGRSDSLGVATCDGGRARALRMQGKLVPAIEATRRALAAYEETRPGIYRTDLRSAFFGGVQDIFDVQIALLLDLGDDRAAFETAERARARSLRDGLREAGAEIRRDASPELLQRERNLRGRLDNLDSTAREVTPGSLRAKALQGKIREALEALEAARGEIRRDAPEYASLLWEAPVSADQIQAAMPQGHVLLKVRLGALESTLWALTRDELQSFRLPPRDRIETLVREAREQLQSLRWTGQRTSLCQLSEIVLEPAQAFLPGRSLILVLDGALENLPFAALPLPGTAAPCAQAPFLGDAHEILHLPSASLLVERPWADRADRADRADDNDRPWIAMVADPVYAADDERLGPMDPPPLGSGTAFLVREALARLPHSAAEAEAVLSQVPEHRRVSLLGTEAQRQAVLGGAVSSARILHFAVHGVHEPQPLLSRLALSTFSPDGSSISGSLFAYELFDLDLAADLVVLSACDTAAGTQVRGEGAVSGLVRGFFYAGADRILASLWPVPDAGTAKLMGPFYRGLLDEGLAPARALQRAQSELRDQGAPPRAWAGFVLQGSPEDLQPFLP